MGLAEGGLPPLSTHIVTSEVGPERRGLAVGVFSTIGGNAIPMLGPLVVVGIGTLYGWRAAFWITGIPGLAMAALIWLLVRNPAHERADDVPRGSVLPLLKIRNIRFTLVMATLNMTIYVGVLGFLPLYLVNVLGLSNAMMAVVITAQGVIAILFGFLFPMLSDRFGRKPAIMVSYAVTGSGLLLLALGGGAIVPGLCGDHAGHRRRRRIGLRDHECGPG